VVRGSIEGLRIRIPKVWIGLLSGYSS